ncbi:MAG TPA: methyl-accepting chemotaxis protein [Bacillota bacterium]|nr:methyl-accepting chemotaxis protein [Bacillota bacterium]
MNWYRNMKIGNKLFLMILIAITFVSGIGSLNYIYGNKLNQDTKAMYEDVFQSVSRMKNIQQNLEIIDADVLKMILTVDKSYKEELQKQIQALIVVDNQMISAFDQNSLSFEEKRIWNEFRDSLLVYRQHRQEVINLALANQSEKAYPLIESQVEKDRKKTIGFLEKLIVNRENDAKLLHDESEAGIEHFLWMNLSFTVSALLILSFLGAVFIQMITRPIKEIENVMLLAENGDLTGVAKYLANDEIGRLTESYNHMIHGIRQTITKVQDQSNELEVNSNELLSDMEEVVDIIHEVNKRIQMMANGANRQYQQSVEGAQAIEEMSMGLQRIAENATHVSEASNETSQHASKGKDSVQVVLQQMQKISAGTQESSIVVASLNSRLQSIEEIVSVINEISSQTNLLSLNATIEAARAGDQGKGFAVVAGEVRRLAEQSSKSAEEIKGIIRGIHNDSIQTVSSMKKVTEEVESGVLMMHQLQANFTHIFSGIEQVSGEIQDVSATSQQLSAGSQQINATIADMASIARVNAQESEQVAISAQKELEAVEKMTKAVYQAWNMAKKLEELVMKFKL